MSSWLPSVIFLRIQISSKVRTLPDVLPLPEIRYGTTSIPVHPLRCAAICIQIVSQCQNDAHPMGASSCHNIVQSLHALTFVRSIQCAPCHMSLSLS